MAGALWRRPEFLRLVTAVVGIGPAFAALTEWSTRGSTPVPEAAATAG
ncbi:hypothetical protein ACIBEK_33885 [Nocardia fusca]